MWKNNNKNSYREKYLKLISNQNDRSQEPNWENQTNNLKDLIDIALELWKIEKKVNKINANFWTEFTTWFDFPIKKIYEILANNKIKIIDYTWKKYIEGMNWIEVISVEKSNTENETIILDTIMPLVELDSKIYIKSKVIVLL